MKSGLLLSIAALALLCFGASGEPKEARFALESPSIADSGAIPWKHAMKRVKGGENLSPQLDWKSPPPDAKSFVISCIDAHPMANRWVHWMVLDIPASCRELKEGASRSAMPSGCQELDNSFCVNGWGGPQPPAGSGEHKYVFTIYALSVPSLAAGKKFLSEKELFQAMQGKVCGKASFTGTFQR